MALALVLLVVIIAAGYGLVRRALRQGLTTAGLAWRAAQSASAALALSVLVYRKPQSFYR